MKKIYILLALFSFKIGAATTNEDLRYHEVCFLTSHNSYAAHDHGYFYGQQALTLTEQLKQGVRGFMLDTHVDRQGAVALCHGNERITRFIKRGHAPLLLEQELSVFLEFLADNPTDIITIFLENYVYNGQLLDRAFKASGIASYILTPKEWDPVAQKGWPSLSWMREHNKRVIIFNSVGETELTFSQWEHVAENQWGTLLTRRACKERKESAAHRDRTRYLYIVNYFPSFRMNTRGSYHDINGVKLDQFLAVIFKGMDGLYAHKRLPNFISVDFINEGTAMNHVLKYNSYSQEHRQTLYRPLTNHGKKTISDVRH